MKYLELRIRGERWLAYPEGMRFPRLFARNYPFRGRGIVSNVLFAINRLGLDKLFLRLVEDASLDRIGMDSVAYFWPSAKRSTSRFYGYRIKDGSVIEYLKFGLTDKENDRLRQEANNVSKALAIADRTFEVPQCLGIDERNGVLVARYEPLPETSTDVPVTEACYSRIDAVRKKIADAGYSHGDFGWHNIKVVNGKLWVLDWEEMSRGLPPLSDKVSFAAMLKYYNQNKLIKEVWHELVEECNGDIEGILRAAISMRRRKIAMGDILMRYAVKKGIVRE